MMLRKLKNIHLIVLLLSGIIIFAHAIIPHDHHYAYNSEVTQHSETQNHSEAQNQLLHCDALNNLIFLKPEVKINKIQEFKSFSGNNILKQLHISDFKFTEKTIIFPEKYLQLPKYIFSKIEPARGSPEIS